MGWPLASGLVRILVAASLAAIGTSSARQPLLAQEPAGFAGFQFNRSLPGARSLAMAGAFVALADDATAAYANPAGLTLLTRREVSLEQRVWQTTTTFTSGGRIDGPPSHIGIDTASGLLEDQSTVRTDNVSFFSYVETAAGRRYAIAVYHHVLVDYSNHFDSQGIFTSDPAKPRLGPYRFETSLNVADTGVAAAYQFGDCAEPAACVRVGAGVASYHLNLAGREQVFNKPANNGPADFTQPARATASEQGNDNALAANVGIIWEAARQIKVGFTYRQGPSFAISEREFAPPIPDQLKLPDQYAAGVTYQPTSSLTLSLELDRVTYSNLVQNHLFRGFTLRDGTEARLGAEHVFFLGNPITPTRLALMGGAWADPNHQIAFTGISPSPITNRFQHAFFPASGSTTAHVTAGVGANFGNLQADAGCDGSRHFSFCALSGVFRF